eukprot:2129588-Amphidinium_carterae.1
MAATYVQTAHKYHYTTEQLSKLPGMLCFVWYRPYSSLERQRVAWTASSIFNIKQHMSATCSIFPSPPQASIRLCALPLIKSNKKLNLHRTTTTARLNEHQFSTMQQSGACSLGGAAV